MGAALARTHCCPDRKTAPPELNPVPKIARGPDLNDIAHPGHYSAHPNVTGHQNTDTDFKSINGSIPGRYPPWLLVYAAAFLELCPSIFQGYCPIEDRPVRCTIGIHAEIAEPVELELIAHLDLSQTRLQVAWVKDLE